MEIMIYIIYHTKLIVITWFWGEKKDVQMMVFYENNQTIPLIPTSFWIVTVQSPNQAMEPNSLPFNGLS